MEHECPPKRWPNWLKAEGYIDCNGSVRPRSEKSAARRFFEWYKQVIPSLNIRVMIIVMIGLGLVYLGIVWPWTESIKTDLEVSVRANNATYFTQIDNPTNSSDHMGLSINLDSGSTIESKRGITAHVSLYPHYSQRIGKNYSRSSLPSTLILAFDGTYCGYHLNESYGIDNMCNVPLARDDKTGIYNGTRSISYASPGDYRVYLSITEEEMLYNSMPSKDAFLHIPSFQDTVANDYSRLSFFAIIGTGAVLIFVAIITIILSQPEKGDKGSDKQTTADKNSHMED